MGVVVAALLLLALFIFCCVRSYKRRQEQRAAAIPARQRPISGEVAGQDDDGKMVIDSPKHTKQAADGVSQATAITASARVAEPVHPSP